MVWKTNFESVEQCGGLEVADVSRSVGRQPLDVTVAVSSSDESEDEGVTTIQGNERRHHQQADKVRRLLFFFLNSVPCPEKSRVLSQRLTLGKLRHFLRMPLLGQTWDYRGEWDIRLTGHKALPATHRDPTGHPHPNCRYPGPETLPCREQDHRTCQQPASFYLNNIQILSSRNR